MSSTSPRQMRFGAMVNATGNHIAGWRHPDAQSGPTNIDLMIEIAQVAERGMLDFLFFADGLVSGPNMRASQIARFEPITLLSALARETKNIGLAGTVNTTYTEPFNVARLLASLDHLSNGRAGWNIVTGSDGRAAANYGRDEHLEHDRRYELAEEYFEVVSGLWESWDADAFLIDKQSGRYVDPKRLNRLDHKGKHFSVAGPINISRSPQTRPVIFQAGASPSGMDFAAKTAEAVFTPAHDLAGGQKYYQTFKGRVEAHGRRGDDVLVMPAIYYVVAETEEQAQKEHELLQSYLREADPVGELSWRLGYDLSSYDVDGPVPDLPKSNNAQYEAAYLMEKARRENLTIRQLFEKVAGGLDAMNEKVLVGAPEQIADELEERFVNRAADGFILQCPYFPGGLTSFVDLVVPILQQRGLMQMEYAGGTLREKLGLPDYPKVGGRMTEAA